MSEQGLVVALERAERPIGPGVTVGPVSSSCGSEPFEAWPRDEGGHLTGRSGPDVDLAELAAVR